MRGVAIAGAFALVMASALLLSGSARAAEPAPVGTDDAYAVPHDGALSVDAANGVLANDIGTGLVAELWTEPTFGELLLAPDGGFVYRRTVVAREDAFVYLASDPDELSTEPVKVRLRFENKPPVCDVVRVTGSPAGALVEVDLAAACVDADGDPMTFSYQQPDVPDGSLWEADALGHVRFLPPFGWTGTGTVVFSAGDGMGESMSAALAIEVVAGS